MLTRLHLRYTKDSLPEDLVFQETQDRANFQARYVLRHPWQGSVDACAEAKPYFDAVRQRQEQRSHDARLAHRLAGAIGPHAHGVVAADAAALVGKHVEVTEAS